MSQRFMTAGFVVAVAVFGAVTFDAGVSANNRWGQQALGTVVESAGAHAAPELHRWLLGFFLHDGSR